MKYLLPAILLFLTACDPCNCEDCCGTFTIFGFKNDFDRDIETIWYRQDGAMNFVSDTLSIPAGEGGDLYGFGWPLLLKNISEPPFREDEFTFDSLHIKSEGRLLERFDQTDCTLNPLCKSAYSETFERGRRRSSASTRTFIFFYEYE